MAKAKKTARTFVWMGGLSARLWCRNTPPEDYLDEVGYIETVSRKAVEAVTYGLDEWVFADGPVEVV